MSLEKHIIPFSQNKRMKWLTKKRRMQSHLVEEKDIPESIVINKS